jgi:thioesterase domain-containing protein
VRSIEVLEKYPGPMLVQLPMHVTTDAAMDWPEAAAQLAARGVCVEVLHVADAVQNLEDLRRMEAEFKGMELEERRSAWRLMADLDAESVAIRALLPQLAALAPDGDQASDPRLQAVQRIVDAELAFWREAPSQRMSRSSSAVRGCCWAADVGS